MIVREADDRDQRLWDEFVSRFTCSAYHRYAWRRLIERVYRRQTYYLGAFRGGDIAGVLPMVRLKSLVFGDFLVSLPYFNYGGPLGDDVVVRQLLEHAVSLGQRLGVAHIEFRPTPGFERSCYVGLAERADKVTMRLALPSDPDCLFRSFKPKLRSQIRRPLKAGAEACHGTTGLVGEFYKVFSENMRDLGTPVFSRELPEAIVDTFPQDARIFVVRMGNEPVAAAVVVSHGELLEIPWASSLRRANCHSVNMLLYWSVLEWACLQGFKIFDFGRSTVDSGTFRFKRQWGAEPLPMPWYYWTRRAGPIPHISPDNAKYRLAIKLWRRLPLPIANLLGPLIAKNLP